MRWLKWQTESRISDVVAATFVDEGIVQYQYKYALEKYKALLLHTGNKSDLKMLRQLSLSLNSKVPLQQSTDAVDRAVSFCNAAVTTFVSIPLLSMYWNVALEILGFPDDFDGYVKKVHIIHGLRVSNMDNLRSAIRRELEEFINMTRKYPDVPAYLYRVGLYKFPFDRMHDDYGIDLKTWWSYFDERFEQIESEEPSVIREFFQPFHEDFDGNIVMPSITVKSVPALVWRTIKEGYYGDFRDIYKLVYEEHVGEFPHLPNKYSDPEGPSMLAAISAVTVKHIQEGFINKLKKGGLTDGYTNAEAIHAYLGSIQPSGTYMTLANEILTGTILKGNTMEARTNDFYCIKEVWQAQHKRESMLRKYNQSPNHQLPPPGDGRALEEYCAELLSTAGFDVNRTPVTADQGVDLIVKRRGETIAVQIKNYTEPVGNKAVQEVLAGTLFYRCDKGMVISPSGFTRSAIQLANSTGVMLIDQAVLQKWSNSGTVDRF